MRKIIMIALLAGLGYGGAAHASPPPEMPAAIGADKHVGDAIYGKSLEIVHITYAEIEDDGVVPLPNGGFKRNCKVRVEIELPSGRGLQLHGDTLEGNGSGRLTPINDLVNYPKEYELGRFAVVGKNSILLEVRGENSLALFGLWRIAEIPGRDNVMPYAGTGLMVTDGHVLARYKRFIGTGFASGQDLAGAFSRAQSIPEVAARASAFLDEFVGNGDVPDMSRPRNTCGSSRCGAQVYAPNGNLVAVNPGYMQGPPPPGVTADMSLQTPGMYLNR